MNETLAVFKRSDKVAFFGVPSEDGTYTFHRMKGFDDISTSKNPKEYSRQYVDEDFEQTDVVGYNPSIAFNFDRIKENAVHNDIISIYDNEKVGADAVRPIVIVDMSDKSAIKREFAVIAENEGSGTEAYKYSGTFRVKGDKVVGTASSDDDWQTINFAEAPTVE